MKTKTQAIKSIIAIGAGTLLMSLMYAQLDIRTDINNAVQTIGKIIVTQNGTSSTPSTIVLDGTQGSINAGDPTTNVVEADRSSVLAGKNNKIVGSSSQDSAIVGGTNNTVNASLSTINGGYQNIINSTYSTIGGGASNTINGTYSAIAGGQNNTISADHGFIAGGNGNQVNAVYGFAGGYFAYANAAHSFVWADGNYDITSPLIATKANSFIIGAAGGVGINTASPTVALDVVGSGKFSAGVTAPSFHGNLNGTADYATNAGRAISANNADAADLATNANKLGGKDASSFVDTSATAQTKAGDLTVNGTVTSNRFAYPRLNSLGTTFDTQDPGLDSPMSIGLLDRYNEVLKNGGVAKTTLPRGTILDIQGRPGHRRTQIDFDGSSNGDGNIIFRNKTTWNVNSRGNWRRIITEDINGIVQVPGALNALANIIAPLFVGNLQGNATSATTAGYADVAGDATYADTATNLSVSRTCPAGQSIRELNTDGSVTCEYDDSGVSSVEERDDISTRTPSGFYQSSTPTVSEGWPQDSSWYQMIASTHSNGGNYFSMQLAGGYWSQDLYYRQTSNDGNQSWRRVMMNSDMGSYVDTSSNQTIGGVKTFTSNLAISTPTYGIGQFSWKANGGLAGYGYSDGGGVGIANGSATSYGELLYLENGSHSINLYTNDTLKMKIDADGNVKIGTTPITEKLSVGGNVSVVGKTSIGQNTNGTAVIDAHDGNAYFGTNTAENGIAIDANGNVGIGGNISVGGNVSAGRWLPKYSTRIGGTDGDSAIVNENSVYKSLMIVGNNSAGGARKVHLRDDVIVDQDLAVQRNATLANTYTDTINSITAGDSLELNYRSTSPTKICATQGCGIYTNFDTAGNVSVAGTLTVASSVTASAFYYNSDRRLKTDITTITDALDKINQLNGYTFTWKKDGKKDIGVIAQEVEKVFPQAVTTDKTTGLKSVEYGNLIAPVIEAIKSLYTKYLDQQAKIDSLEKRIEALEASK